MSAVMERVPRLHAGEPPEAEPPCAHVGNFEAEWIVAPRFGDRKEKCVIVRVRCAECKLEFRFEGLPGGVLHGTRPGTPSYIGYSAVLPISPLTESEGRIVRDVDPWDRDSR